MCVADGKVEPCSGRELVLDWCCTSADKEAAVCIYIYIYVLCAYIGVLGQRHCPSLAHGHFHGHRATKAVAAPSLELSKTTLDEIQSNLG